MDGGGIITQQQFCYCIDLSAEGGIRQEVPAKHKVNKKPFQSQFGGTPTDHEG